MSYYYDVKIALSEAGYNECKVLFQKKFPNKVFLLDSADEKKRTKDNILIFSFCSFNRWDTNNDCLILENLLKIINEKGFGYNLVKIGENREDIYEDFVEGHDDSEKFETIFVSRSIEFI